MNLETIGKKKSSIEMNWASIGKNVQVIEKRHPSIRMISRGMRMKEQAL